MTNLAEFLLARIAEDEEVAQEALARASVYGDREVTWKWLRAAGGSTMWEPTNHTPARVLAECEAKRRILEALDYTPCPCQRADRCVIHDASAGPPEFARERFVDPTTEAVLLALALPYADHPAYREEWRP